MYKRLFHHSVRFKTAFLYGTGILSAMVIMLTAFYPGEEGVVAYFGYLAGTGFDVVFGNIDLGAPGFILWISLQIDVYLYYVLMVAAVNIGARLIPTTDEDSVELLMSVPRKPRLLFIENFSAAALVLALIMIPSYLILIGYCIYYDSTNILVRLLLSYLFTYVLALFFVMLAASFAIIKYSRSAGQKAGFAYLVYSFFVDLAASSPDYKDITNSSLKQYLNASSGIISGEFDWEPVYVILALIFVLFCIALYSIKWKEFIQKSPKPEKTKVGLSALVAPTSQLSQRFPVLMDQLREDIGFLTIWGTIIAIFLAYFPYFAPSEDSIREMLRAFDLPYMRAFTLGHNIHYDYTGFMSFEFYGLIWMYFGVFILFIAASIPTREVKRGSQDVLWSTETTVEHVITLRTLMLLIEVTILIWGLYAVLATSEAIFAKDVDRLAEFSTFLIIWLHGIGTSLFLVMLAMLPSVNKGKTVAVWFFIYSSLALVAAFSSESLEFLQFTSIYRYADTVGVIYGDTSLVLAFSQTIAFLLVSAIGYFFVLKYKYKRTDFC